MQKQLGLAISGAAAGAVCGLFGAGGGMVLVPLLGLLTDIPSGKTFFVSVAIMLPIVITSLLMTGITWQADYLPFLLGSAMGGLLAGAFGEKIPETLMHKALGLLILWAGVRYLC